MNQPAVITAYNQVMGGADFPDCALSDLRPVIQGKKWYWSLVINALIIVFVYTWPIFRIISEEPMPRKSYCRQIVGIFVRRAHPKIIRSTQDL